jgi:hypothetical protein
VVLKLNKLTQPTIGLTLAVFTTTTKKIIEEAIKRWGVKFLPDNVKMCSMPNHLAPKSLKGRRNFPPLTTGTVLIRLDRREDHSHTHTRVLTDLVGTHVKPLYMELPISTTPIRAATISRYRTQSSRA